MSTITDHMAANATLTQRERELGAIIDAYNQVTEQLKQSHERLRDEVARLREELARKNRQLRRRERLAALGEMAAGVAHEIRNPLGGIQLFASLLQKDLQGSPAQARLVNKIAQGVASVESIVTDFLEFGRPRDPEPRPLRVDAVVREAVELALHRAAESGVRIETVVPGDLNMVSDAAMIKRALLNLLLNAVDASRGVDGGGQVTVGARMQDPEHVNIAVADNGPGVPAELMDRIFNPFFTTKDRGTGLGLAIVHQIAELLGGNVQVANAPQGGAVFSMCLPVRVTECERANG
ncbi:MAG TPA: ATP-binding protein [Phycisphaerae bacterium]|nr:ATP-binding protein [Phycisphaerae bacterium]HOM51364.1 ATP-binding protein [Phycisphaerae bacterium]HOQ85005.1 ATP-binding protein [Phycisphaerae bacterium]HPP26673.1 ATP-binding protein [Phycisphaerae bacterium]HPU25999.1 ATP-binding protein [Phycisphaerae bacterium]